MKMVHDFKTSIRPVHLGLLMLMMLGALAGQAGAAFKSAGPWGTIVVGKQSEPERLATVDLQRYLGQVTGKVPSIVDLAQWQKSSVPAVFVGTPAGNPFLGASSDLDATAMGEEGYYLNQVKAGQPTVDVVIAAGQTPAGAVNAVYGLLKELGYGFYLGSEALPASLPPALKGGPIVRQPSLKMRGVLPWYNFFDSPTAWDPIDHRAFVDQLVRLGANFVGFHTYDGEPFAACEVNGTMVGGERLLNTGSSTWGTHPMPSSEYGYGTSKLFAQKYFGADTTIAIPERDAAIRAEQDVMRDALDYAKKRGLHTCIGFEAIGDPTKPQDRESFLKRLNHLLDQYPSLDYMWIWQPESEGVQGFCTQYVSAPLAASLDPASRLIDYGLARRELFRRVVENPTEMGPMSDREAENVARAIEGARLEQFSQLAYRALAHRAAGPRLVVSGWGGEDRALSAEYYEALDKVLPHDVVFSSLEYIFPRENIDKIYSELPKDRQRWPIPWLENDGDQWHPQPFVHIYEKMMKKVQQSGSQGLLAIHWRTRDVEENFGYLVESAWNPSLTADQFFADMARRCYDPAIAPQMAAIHDKLDALQYRWAGGFGQSECGNFTWAVGDAGKLKELESLRVQAAQLLPKADRSKARLQHLLDSMDWVILYEKAQIAVLKAQDLIGQAGKVADKNPEQAGNLARQALAAMDQDSMAVALQAFARRIATRGEYGVLATINTKAVWEWRNVRKQAEKFLGDKVVAEKGGDWKPAPQIQLPRFLGSVEAGQALELLPVVMGGAPAWIHYRTLGQKDWTSRKLTPVKDWVQQAVIPAEVVKEPGLELGFSFSRFAFKGMALGPLAVTVMPKSEVCKTPPTVAPFATKAQLTPAVRAGKTSPLELTWNEIPEADYYRVLRDGRPVIETAATFLPDYPTQGKGEYGVEAWRDGKLLTQSAPVAYRVADKPFTEPFSVTLKANQGGVLVSWPATKSPAVTSYKVELLSKAGGKKAVKLLTQVSASRINPHAFHHVPAKGEWIYRVTPINSAGRRGNAAMAPIQFPPAPQTTPAIDLPLTQKPDKANVVGNVSFDQDGANFLGGYMELPHLEAMRLAGGMTMTYEFKIEETGNEPIMLCHGIWHGDGWYAQVLGRHLMIKMPGYDVNGPQIETGRWYKVQLVYDGSKAHLAVDGQWIPLTQTADIVAADSVRPLVFGQYVDKGDRYRFLGRIRNLKIYSDVLMDVNAK